MSVEFVEGLRSKIIPEWKVRYFLRKGFTKSNIGIIDVLSEILRPHQQSQKLVSIHVIERGDGSSIHLGAYQVSYASIVSHQELGSQTPDIAAPYFHLAQYLGLVPHPQGY